MGLIPRVVCRRCGRQYSGLRGRCPFCGTRRVKQSERVPASSAGTDPATSAGERAASNARWQLIFGGILLLAVILAVVVLVSISLNGASEQPSSPTFDSFSEPPATATPVPPPTQAPTPTPTIESVSIYHNGQALADGFAMRPSFNGPGNTLVVSANAYPLTVDISEGITWSSSDESVITVTPTAGNPTTCTVTQVGNGTAKLTLTVYGVSTSLTVWCADL